MSHDYDSGIILGMGSANEKRRYIVTSFLIGWAHAQNDSCDLIISASRGNWKFGFTFYRNYISYGCIFFPLKLHGLIIRMTQL